MPELPEIETLRSTLSVHLINRKVERVTLNRRDVVRNSSSKNVRRQDLLAGHTVIALHRRGKQLAIEAEKGQILLVHLGMTGQLRVLPPNFRITELTHVHCLWHLRNEDRSTARMIFRDPRRFGGLWIFNSMSELIESRWSKLGPDGLKFTVKQLKYSLSKTHRPIKAALLDQSVIAGLGNIYVDEALFISRIHPLTLASNLPEDATKPLANAIRQVLRRSIRHGGSTTKDYVDGEGNAGSFVKKHKVYGRGGSPCLTCGKDLQTLQIAQRTTVACIKCQTIW